MSRLRQVPKAEASAEVRAIYQEFFGERDPVAEPGTATGTPGDTSARGSPAPKFTAPTTFSPLGSISRSA